MKRIGLALLLVAFFGQAALAQMAPLASGQTRDWLIKGYCAATTAAQATVWNHTAAYGYQLTAPTIASTSTLQIASTAARTTSALQRVQIVGLDANWNIQAKEVSWGLYTNTTGTLATGTWRRVFSVKNTGPTSNIGTTYVLTTGTVTSGVPVRKENVQAKVVSTDGISYNPVWTVPAGEQARLNFILVPGTITSGRWIVLIRPYGSAWRTLIDGNTTGRIDLAGGAPLLEQKTDIRVDIVGASTSAYCYLGLTEIKP
jgi:hypothetical protein